MALTWEWQSWQICGEVPQGQVTLWIGRQATASPPGRKGRAWRLLWRPGGGGERVQEARIEPPGAPTTPGKKIREWNSYYRTFEWIFRFTLLTSALEAFSTREALTRKGSEVDANMSLSGSSWEHLQPKFSGLGREIQGFCKVKCLLREALR